MGLRVMCNRLERWGFYNSIYEVGSEMIVIVLTPLARNHVKTPRCSYVLAAPETSCGAGSNNCVFSGFIVMTEILTMHDDGVDTKRVTGYRGMM